MTKTTRAALTRRSLLAGASAGLIAPALGRNSLPK